MPYRTIKEEKRRLPVGTINERKDKQRDVARMKENIAHISIDDVTFVLQRLSTCACDSIYNEPFFRYLHFLHRMFGLKITLYGYAQNGKWSLADIPERYKQELEEASSWLKFGFHAVSDEQKENNIIANFEGAFIETSAQIERFAGTKSVARILRLHYWFYPQEYLEVLRNHGVRTILIKEGLHRLNRRD